MVKPVKTSREVFIIHARSGNGHIDGDGFGILLDVAFPSLFVEVEDVLGATQGVYHGVTGEVFNGVVGAIVAAPTGDAFEIPSVVEVTVVEDFASRGLCAHELAL